MSYPVPTGVKAGEQPVEYIEEICGVYFRGICLKQWDAVPQHSHDYAHATLVASGKVRVWIEGAYVGEVTAPKAIEIEAHRHHVFQALEPDTRLFCVHNLNGEAYQAGPVKQIGG